ncbi:ParA family protein [Amantichitinum ursilacus]|uniref:Sporulation initiation inhibitor protein Soj n=1 Tax=Amantichitinum ursilacus TaxID=857265 RepID=A0A0N0XL73_9NEIS|nr:ParA family protein [Amantichitinum ursilacus]KPC55284.1 Sporulation initiation inhibitor protein Soj [Amantichitinum ursilacus]
MTIIAVFNQKGGVGKTTVSANLAAAMARNGVQPLVIDLDPQAHLTSLVGMSPASVDTIFNFYRGTGPLTELITSLPNGVHFIPSHLELGKVDAQITRHRDNVWRLKLGLTAEMLSGGEMPIIIDCTPNLGVLAFSALFAADMVLVPVAAEYLAVNGANLLQRTLAGLEKFGPRIPRRYLINRYVPDQVTSEKIAGQLARTFPGEILRTRIREQEVIAAAAGSGEDIFEFAPESKAATDFAFLLDELLESGLLEMQSD